jgi:hypothetical protein
MLIKLSASIANPTIGFSIVRIALITVCVSLTAWQDGNIVELNDAGEWFVNTPDIAFNDIGDLLDEKCTNNGLCVTHGINLHLST